MRTGATIGIAVVFAVEVSVPLSAEAASRPLLATTLVSASAGSAALGTRATVAQPDTGGASTRGRYAQTTAELRGICLSAAERRFDACQSAGGENCSEAHEQDVDACHVRYADPVVPADPVAAPTCETWNTPDFFSSATPEVVSDCLAGGVDVGARDVDGRTSPPRRTRLPN